MNLHDLNTLSKDQLRVELLKCCGSASWADRMIPFFPIEDLVDLLEDAEKQWFLCSESDWKEAFSQHRSIGDLKSKDPKFEETQHWAKEEQAGVATANKEVLDALAAANRRYESKFGYTFIVCATGKSAAEMLGILHTRLENDPAEEIRTAADEQSQITKLRIEKLLEVDR